MPRRRVYLIGFMGAGKTSVGSRLAVRMGVEFVDLDREIERMAGRSVPELFAERGEQGFRDLESEALERLADVEDDLVIATGGGSANRPENVEFMRATGVTLWLDPSFEAILGRLSSEGRSRRPLFSSPSQARALYEERRDGYAGAGLRVVVGPADSSDEIAERISRKLSQEDGAWSLEDGE